MKRAYKIIGLAALIVVLAVIIYSVLMGRGRTPSPTPWAQPKFENRYGPVSFNSDLSLNVYMTRLDWDVFFQCGGRILGETPSLTAINIPECTFWWVEPKERPDWNELAREIELYKIPGLDISNATDADIARIREINGLEWLALSYDYYGPGQPRAKITSEGLAMLAGIKDLMVLNIHLPPLSGEQPAPVVGFENLLALKLTGSVSDESLSWIGLQNMKNLRGLDLSFADINDDSLKQIALLKELRSLQVGFLYPQITDEGLAHLVELRELRSLGIGNCYITDDGLALLGAFDNLSALALGGLSFTDNGLAHLKSLNNLEHLSLNNAAVTDAGLAHIKELENLKGLVLHNTEVTRAGVRKLRQARPDLNVTWIGSQ